MYETWSAVFGAMVLALVLFLLALAYGAWKSPGARLKRLQYESDEDGTWRLNVETRKRPDESRLRAAWRYLSAEGKQ